jgi:4-carboxymuconolactone decarboxylase
MTDSAQRIPSVPRENWTDAVREVFAVYEGREGWENGSKYNFIHFFANHPPLAKAWLAYNQVLTRGAIDPILREVIILRTAHNFRSEYEWSMHMEICRHHLGMRPDHFEAIQKGPESAFWPALERDCLRAVDQLCFDHDIDDALWNALAARFDQQHMMELLFLVGSYALLSWVLHTARLPLETRPARLADVDA